MTEGNEIPEIAEAKDQPSHQVQALKKEIVDFAGTQIQLLEEIERLQTLIDDRDDTIKRQVGTLCELSNENKRLTHNIIAQRKARSEERRVGKEYDNMCRTRWSTDN